MTNVELALIKNYIDTVISNTTFVSESSSSSSISEEAVIEIIDENLSDTTSLMYTTLNSKENTSNKVTSLSSSSTDNQYPSAKCVYDLIGDIETLLSQV